MPKMGSSSFIVPLLGIILLLCLVPLDSQLLRPDKMDLGSYNPDTKHFEKKPVKKYAHKVSKKFLSKDKHDYLQLHSNLIGDDDHDYKTHKKAFGRDDHDYKHGNFIGGGDHDYQQHGKLIGGGDHDYRQHGKLIRGGEHDYQQHGKLIGGGDHDYQQHGKLIGGGDHDYQQHGKLIGGDDHDYQQHGKLIGGGDHDYQQHGKLIGGGDHDYRSHKKPLGRGDHDYKHGKLIGGGNHDYQQHGRLIGGGDHDYMSHGLYGRDDHDYKQHGKLIGGGDHDYQPHGKHFGGKHDLDYKKPFGNDDHDFHHKKPLGRGDHDYKPHKLTGNTHGKHFGGGNHDLKPHRKPLGRGNHDYKSHQNSKHLFKFHRFTKKFNKVYSGPEEFKIRFEIFKDNMKKAKILQKSDGGTAKFGFTKFSDLTSEEFNQMLGLRPDKKPATSYLKTADLSIVKNVNDVPKEFDWRSKNVVTPVKNQGMCGSCWAFSVTGNVEGQYALKHKELVSLSEQELIDCDDLDSGCNGGLPENAYQAIDQLGGLETEKAYPYEGRDDKCQFNVSKARVMVNGSIELPKDEDFLKKWLFKDGPISIGINANMLQFYVGGVSHPPRVLCNPKDLDHGVLIVGYGVHTTKYLHRTQPYWLVKNSWGDDWGEKGYFRVYRGDGTCGVNMMATSSKVE